MLEIGQRLGGYTIDQLLGEDALASTWQLTGPDGHHYVLRLLQVRLPDFQERFRRAGEVLRGVRHPNLVRVRQLLEHDGLPAVLTEHVGGGDLGSWIGGQGRAAREVLPVFHGLVAGVGAAHEAGLVHRNLKPSKVLITGAGTPKVNDFALGKVTASTDGNQALTQMGTTFGTPQYMPPEQFRGAGEVDHRADIFALGCLLYEMLAGHRAFRPQGLMQVYDAVLDSDYDPLPPDVPAALVGLVADLLCPEPEGRPPSTQDILTRLQEDDEVAALLPSYATRGVGPTLVATSLSPELKEAMEAEEQAEAAARAAAERRRLQVEERARRKKKKDEPAPEPEPRRPISAIPPTPAPLAPRQADAKTIPPERPVQDRGRTLPPEQVFVDDVDTSTKLRWQLAVLVAVGIGLVAAVIVLGLAIYKG